MAVFVQDARDGVHAGSPLAKRAPLAWTVAATCVFACEGLRDGLFGVVWPSMRASFDVPVDALGILLATFGAGYVAVSAFTGSMFRRLPLRRLAPLSTIVMAIALLSGFATSSWPVMIGCFLVGGFGAGGCDAALNTYAATAGGPRVMGLLQAGYATGAVAGPLAGGLVRPTESWRFPFLVLGIALTIVTPVFMVSGGRGGSATTFEQEAPRGAMGSVFRPRLAIWIGIALFVLYSGLELSIGLWAFTLLTEWQAQPPLSSAAAVSLFWAGMVVSRGLLSVWPELPAAGVMVRVSLIALVLGLALFLAARSPAVGLAALFVAGLAAGPVFPSLMTGTSARAGSATETVVGWQTAAATVGQVIVPSGIGVLHRIVGLRGIADGLLACGALAILLHESLERLAPTATKV